ncbi:NTPase [Sphaerisporangium melleum]|uniref:NTPase n=1 Tax=Sphaerisporangium melleum TaxID=321316 RepID=A0A917R825_9ACTN|nr:FxSxx-COOH system tetratricopeptide repeat protein [Sphaerisporangium melleum]GGK94198.1 NTPase [Sphaerisporangium melleum]GII73216.1 NTPase [Sphaerisporangium melleum]
MTEASVIAFFSARPGVGRTIALCNTAVVLADAGKRVLILDEDPDAPALRRYLGRFLPPGSRDPLTASPRDWRSREVPVHAAHRRLHHALLAQGPVGAGALRAAPFDHVLVNLRTSPVPSALVKACDQVVLCFQLSPYGIEEASVAAAAVERESPRVVPLPTRVDLSGGAALETARRLARGRFTTPPEVEIPYVTDYYYTDDLAAVTEPPGGSGQRAGYERLAEVLTGGAVTALASVSVVHSPGYEVWAEWIAAQAQRWGLRVESWPLAGYLEGTPVGLRSGDGRAAVLFTGPPAAMPEPEPVAGDRPAGFGRGLIRVRVDDDRPEPGRPAGPELDLYGLDEAAAVAELQSRLGVGGTLVPGGGGPGAARYPGRPGKARLPARDEMFAGREETLTRMRRMLGPRWEGPGRCLVTGAEASGKSELALEFAHRFGGAYDTVHWIPAGDIFSVRDGLRQMAHDLELYVRDDAVTALLAHLATPEAGRWLVVLDDADDPAVLAGLIPQGRFGHVIVTSRTAEGWGDAFDGHVAAGPLDPRDAMALLTGGRVRLDESDVQTIATTAGHLPLALRMARTWLDRELASGRRPRRTLETLRDATVKRFLSAYRRTERDMLAAGGQPSPHAVMVELMLDLLRGHSGMTRAEWLLETCSFASPHGVPLALIRSTPSRAYAAGLMREYGDELAVDMLVRLVHDHALARLEHGPQGVLRLHRVIGALIRARMSPRAVEERRRQALRLLALYAPIDTEGPGAGAFAELGDHLEPSGALASDDDMVRRWVVNQVRYLYLQGDRSAWLRARAIGRTALAAWSSTEGGASGPVGNLQVQLANVERALGDRTAAFELTQTALRRLSAAGERHPLRYIAAQAHAADLRVAGEFDEAYHWDSLACAGMTALLGSDHEWSNRTLNNLALSASLNGRPHLAADLIMRCFDDRVRLHGEEDLDAWRAALTAGVLLRDLGEYERAYELQRRGVGVLMRRHAKGGRRGLLVLRLEMGLAACERMLGRPFDALARDRETLEELRVLVGPADLYTALCHAGLAAGLHAKGGHEGAAEHGRAAHAALAALATGHPYAYAAQVNLAAYLRASNAAEARALAEDAYQALRSRLGVRHPYTLAAAGTLATQLTETDPDRALALDFDTHDYLSRLFGPDHPRVRAAADNLANTRHRQAGSPRGTADARHDFEIEILGN